MSDVFVGIKCQCPICLKQMTWKKLCPFCGWGNWVWPNFSEMVSVRTMAKKHKPKGKI